jgi:hypothetical protein
MRTERHVGHKTDRQTDRWPRLPSYESLSFTKERIQSGRSMPSLFFQATCQVQERGKKNFCSFRVWMIFMRNRTRAWEEKLALHYPAFIFLLNKTAFSAREILFNLHDPKILRQLKTATSRLALILIQLGNSDFMTFSTIISGEIQFKRGNIQSTCLSPLPQLPVWNWIFTVHCHSNNMLHLPWKSTSMTSPNIWPISDKRSRNITLHNPTYDGKNPSILIFSAFLFCVTP